MTKSASIAESLKFFAPYAKYTLRTPLDGGSFRAGLKRECGSTFACWKRNVAAFMNGKTLEPVPLSLKRSLVCLGLMREREIVLFPWCMGQNPLRGLIRITVEENGAEGVLLHVVIAPADLRWFCVLWFGFLGFFAAAAMLAGKWVALAPCAPMGGAACLFFLLCRKMAEREIPQIKASLEALLRKLEKQEDGD